MRLTGVALHGKNECAARMKLLHLSGWYRVRVAASLIWVVVMLISIDPWARFPLVFAPGRHNRWADFVLYGILPVVIPWIIIWIVQGFRRDRNKSSGE